MKLSETIAANIIHVYNNLASAQVFSRALMAEKIVPYDVRSMFLNISAACGNGMDRIRGKIPKEDREIFDEQVTNNDPLKLQQILFYYAKMQPSVQAQFEELGRLMANGEVLEIIE